MRVRDWAPIAVLTVVLLLASTGWAPGSGTYWAFQRSLMGNPVIADEYIINYAHYGHTIYRKLSHVAVFLLLGLCMFPLRGNPGALRLAIFCCVIVALGSELVQVFSDTRRPKVYDVGLNLAGVLLGLRLLFHPPRFLRAVASGNWLLPHLRVRSTRPQPL